MDIAIRSSLGLEWRRPRLLGINSFILTLEDGYAPRLDAVTPARPLAPADFPVAEVPIDSGWAGLEMKRDKW